LAQNSSTAVEPTATFTGGSALSTQHSALRLARRYPLGALGALALALMLVVAVVGPAVAPHDPYATNARNRLQSPSRAHLAGTDNLGRDVFSRLIYGARPSVVVGFGALALGLALRVTLGLVSGYLGGLFDLLVQRVMDAMMSLPSLILGLTVIAVIGASYTNLIIAIGIVMTPIVQRVVRGATMAVKSLDHVQAATVIGAGQARVLLRYVLPNVAAPIFVIASVELGSAILIEASLSFLGYGTPPPQPSWGAMLSGEGRRFMVPAPWLVIIPAITISVAILGINLLGDALRDALDPRLRTGDRA
jgi:peptide/nickel transport system permease protein